LIKPREELVGLADVALDRDDVVVERLGWIELDRTQ
jgi:hypothetical protein